MTSNKILTAIILIVIIALGYFYFRSNEAQAPTTDQTPPKSDSSVNPTAPPASPTPDAAKPVAIVDTNMGSFQVTLEEGAAPKTVANFIKLATENSCNNTKFHRILNNFVIQGCDPNSIKGDASTWGQGGPGYTVPAEIGLKANIGAIGMASTAAKGPSSGSQFFIVTTESPNNHASLDGNYTLFGYVTSGMDVVTKIAAVPVQPNLLGEPSLPNTPVIINKITIK